MPLVYKSRTTPRRSQPNAGLPLMLAASPQIVKRSMLPPVRESTCRREVSFYMSDERSLRIA